jgi:hypothetical protein
MEGIVAIVNTRVNELPDWLGPMLVRELRQAMRSPLFLVPFVSVHGVAMIALLVEFNYLQSIDSAGTRYLEFAGPASFWISVTVVLAGVLPMRGFSALHDEMKSRNVELVLMSGLSRWRFVFGQWLVQASLSGLLFVSLIPYIIVRYFFGGVEVAETAMLSVAVLGAAGAANALVLGISGYENLPFRILLLIVAAMMVFPMGGFGAWSVLDVQMVNTGDFFHLVVMLYWMVSLVLFFVFFTLIGLQLSRAHLKTYLRPYDAKPTKLIVTILVLSPFFIGLGSFVTCFYGIGLILGLMVWGIWAVDSGFTRD